MTVQAPQIIRSLRPDESHPEPLDRLNTREIGTLITALRLYYGDLQDVDATPEELQLVESLSTRLANVGRTWIAEVAQP